MPSVVSRIHSPTVAIIGAGFVGSTIAYALAIKNIASELLLIDINKDKQEGEVMDISDAMCFLETGCVRSATYKEARKADIIIVTAGVNQKPGDTRLDLLEKNAGIMQSIFSSIGKLSKDTIVIVVSNPVDVLTQLITKLTKLPAGQVFGTGTTLDSARLTSIVGQELGVSPQSVRGFVLGEHGNSQFVAWSTVTIGGVPAKDIKALNAKVKKRIEKRVKQEAYTIIEKKGATYYGIGLTVADIVEAVLFDQKKIMPISAPLKKWNGVSGTSLGSPHVVGRNGAERQWPMTLPPQEKKQFVASAKLLQSMYNSL
ncbi:MAG: L-lactate dehydrogenase [Candidatus Magasanikbacteria bacterium]|jgi:L-lactate dehydrogenase|nr:L-lactate dehydrogenase [Candidatus Magasanikbacteria bacterium]